MNLLSVPSAALVALRLWLVGGSLRTLSTWRNLRARRNRVKFHLGLSLLVLGASGMTYAAEGKELLAQLPARMAQASSSDVVVDQIGFCDFNRKIGYQRKEAAQHEGQQHKGAGNPVR